jgi:lipopolysaccharide assembly outer membrane protein LptD (OstA)
LGDNIPHVPIFVAYNLFTLQADEVVYDVKSQTLEASGNVVAESSDGTAEHSDSMVFKIKNGKVTRAH